MNAPNNYKIKPEHGGCLTAWLAVSVLAAIVTIVALVGMNGIAQLRGISTLIYILIGASILHVVFIVGIFDWRRWGVYGFIAIVIMSAVGQIIAGVATTRDYAAPFVQLALLYYLIHEKWDYYD